MKCPYCGGLESKVIDSRPLDEEVRRRRKCLACGARFTTYERIQHHNFFVVKKDGRREEFNRDKLAWGIRKACEKRPLRTGAIDKLIDNIEAELYQTGKAEVPSSLIGDLVIEGLRGLDHIAYIRFASVYREFADIGALKEEVDNLATGGVMTPANQLPLLPSEGNNASKGVPPVTSPYSARDEKKEEPTNTTVYSSEERKEANAHSTPPSIWRGTERKEAHPAPPFTCQGTGGENA